ncbi:MAG: translation initiation factor IF-2 [Bacteroidota bacterium]
MISEEDVDKAIKQTLSGMEQSKISATKTKMRKRRLAEREEKEAKKQVEKERELQKLELTEYVTTSDLANLMGKTANDIILKCMELGLMVTINQRLDKDTIILIADDYGFEVEFHDEKEFQFIEEEEDREEDLKPRSPIVTIMGHVDHGKTSLLDHIRSENVVAGEAGGITQHIGAYKVELDAHRSITFLDTPGHEAFTAMRARGAQVTDIVVLVVAADDSVMPQTIEAISHAKAANVPIVVAINKIDKPDARPDRIKQQLSDHNILVEDWGGKYQSIELSAKSGLNVDQLLDKILLEAELLDLKANPDKGARGIVVEANMNKGLGPVATIIIQKGTLNIGDAFVSGVFSGRVRAMLDERGNKVDKAGPSVPVMVVGFDGLPEAGDQFVSVSSDSDARHIATERQQLKREQELRQIRHVTLDEISKQIQLGGVKDLFLVIKGDVSGSVEAISDSLQKLSREEVRVVILHKGVGAISESDVMLAAASHAVIIGFNISPTAQARKAAESEHVDIRLYDIIYDCINEVQLALEGLLSPEYKEETICTVEVRKVFKISRLGSIAGCYVLSGKITRNDKVRVLRDGLPVFDGGIASLKRGKDDVKEVDSGFECGIQLVGFNDFLEGDIIEGYRIVEVRRTLK